MTSRGAEALLGLTAHRTKWQVPGVPEGESMAIDSTRPEASALLRRMRSRSPASQMPPMGTAVQDRDAWPCSAGGWRASSRPRRPG